MSAKDTGPDVPVTAAEGEKADVFESMAQLYTSGIERVAEMQKKPWISQFSKMRNW